MRYFPLFGFFASICLFDSGFSDAADTICSDNNNRSRVSFLVGRELWGEPTVRWRQGMLEAKQNRACSDLRGQRLYINTMHALQCLPSIVISSPVGWDKSRTAFVWLPHGKIRTSAPTWQSAKIHVPYSIASLAFRISCTLP
jgi:hypothetical protein